MLIQDLVFTVPGWVVATFYFACFFCFCVYLKEASLENE